LYTNVPPALKVALPLLGSLSSDVVRVSPSTSESVPPKLPSTTSMVIGVSSPVVAESSLAYGRLLPEAITVMVTEMSMKNGRHSTNFFRVQTME